MSLLRCCTGRKRHGGHKANTKSPPPTDRQSTIGAAPQRTPSFTNLETQQTQPVLSSFRMRADLVPVAPSVMVPTLSPTSNATTYTDIDHSALDQILANLLTDISSPSFQRTTAKSETEKSAQGGNTSSMSGITVIADDLHQSHIDHNANAFSYGESYDDDYDVPCGADGATHPEQSDYVIPPTPTSCLVPVSNSSPSEVSVNNGTKTSETKIDNNDDYDRPRGFREVISIPDSTVDGGPNDERTLTTVTVTSNESHQDSKPEKVGSAAITHESEVTTESTNKTVVISSNSELLIATIGRPIRQLSEDWQSLMETFKTVRLDVLMSMSHLLTSVGASDNDVLIKIGNVVRLSSLLQSSLLKFVEFIRMLLETTPQTYDNSSIASVMIDNINTLNSIRSAIDEYVDGIHASVVSNATNNASVKLAGVIHVTKDLPALLRLFVPLVDRLQTSAQSAECVSDGNAESTRSPQFVNDSDNTTYSSEVTIDEETLNNTGSDKSQSIDSFPRDKMAIDPEEVDVNKGVNSPVKGTKSFPQRGAIVEDSSHVLPPVLPHKQTHMREEVFQNIDVNTTLHENPSSSGSQTNDIDSSQQNNRSDRLLSVSQTDLSDSQPSYEPVTRRQPSARIQTSASATDDDSGCISQSELETPSVRGSGVSQTTADQLEELRRQADSQLVRVHTESTQFVDELDTASSSSCMTSLAVNALSNNDRRLLMFYCGQVNNNWTVLDNAAGAFFHCMERQQSPKVFVALSKFVILAGHKLTYIGGIIARHIEDEKAQEYVIAYSNKLCSSLKVAVRATKEAALKFPDVGVQQLMVDSIKEVTDWTIELKEVTDRLTYLGQLDSSL